MTIMYIEQLEEQMVPIDAICLDPNNPRFWTEKTTKDVPDTKIPDDEVQARTMVEISEHGVEELRDSILRNGFLPLDRIVVRPIAHHPGKYVAVEGNRRLAALKTLRQQISDDLIAEENVSVDYLTQLKDNTNSIEVLVYNGTDTVDIAWVLQGIRHISGVRDWQPAQRARLVASQIDKEHLSFRQAGQQFGLTSHAVGRFYRSFKALEQMRQDDEFQSKARNDYFTLFEEAIRNKDVKQWLGWNDEEQIFKNADNLHQFYSWIVPDEEHSEKRRRLHDPRQIKDLGVLIAGKHDGLLAQIDQHEISIEAATERATQVGQKYNWENALERARLLIADIPQSAIADQPTAVLAKIEQLLRSIKALRKMAEAVQGA